MKRNHISLGDHGGVHVECNGNRFLSTKDDSKRSEAEKKNLYAIQAVPYLLRVNEQDITLIHHHSPLTTFGEILKRDDNVALVSEDYSIILIKTRHVVYCLVDNDVKPNRFAVSSKGQMWYNHYEAWAVYTGKEEELAEMKKPMNITFNITNTTLHRNQTYIYDDSCTVEHILLKEDTQIEHVQEASIYDNVKVLNSISSRLNKRVKYLFSGKYECITLLFGYTRTHYLEHLKEIFKKRFYISLVLMAYGLPYSDINWQIFHGSNAILWECDDGGVFL